MRTPVCWIGSDSVEFVVIRCSSVGLASGLILVVGFRVHLGQREGF